MAESCTATYALENGLPQLQVISLAVVSAADGTCSGTFRVKGRLREILVIPGTGGNQPTASFDIQIDGPDGEVVLDNDALSNSAATIDYPDSDPAFFDGSGACALEMAAMGDSNTCTVKLFVTPE